MSENAKLVQACIDKTNGKFTAEEIESIITMTNRLAEKPVLYALIKVLEDSPSRGFSQEEASELIDQIRNLLKYNYCGFVQCTFNEIAHKLNISLSIVPQDYICQIDVPHEDYAKDVYDKYNVVKSAALTYWKQFTEDNSELISQLKKYRPDLEFDLVIDNSNPTTLYFDPKCPFRIGIFPYYVDQYNRPLKKKST